MQYLHAIEVHISRFKHSAHLLKNFILVALHAWGDIGDGVGDGPGTWWAVNGRTKVAVTGGSSSSCWGFVFHIVNERALEQLRKLIIKQLWFLPDFSLNWVRCLLFCPILSKSTGVSVDSQVSSLGSVHLGGPFLSFISVASEFCKYSVSGVPNFRILILRVG